MRLLIVFAILIGRALGAQGSQSAEAVQPLIERYFYAALPNLNHETRFVVTELSVDRLWPDLHMQVFHAQLLAKDGQQFNSGNFIYYNGTVTPFAADIGGHGLMSGVTIGSEFYYTYSWGSGIHRSLIGRITVVEGKISEIESGGFVNKDLFVRKVGNQIQVEIGSFVAFNSWSGAKYGKVQIRGSSLVLIGTDGSVVTPQF
jgi:hypothetical protein